MAKLTDEQLDERIDKYRNQLSPAQAKILDNMTNTTSIRQYFKKSGAKINKTLRTMKKNIAERYEEDGTPKPYYEQPQTQKHLKKPEPKTKSGIDVSRYAKPTQKIPKPRKSKSVRVKKEIEKQNIRLAPSGRKYSSVELHEGVASKRAMKWRNKNGIPVDDFSKQ